MNATASGTSMSDLLSLALWLAGAGHFALLVASFQVPARLRWSENLATLTPFNRKLMWVYGGFTVFTITAFGTLTLALHDEMLRGDRAAVALAFFIGLYWTARVLVDLLYFTHADWPRGPGMVVGHLLLTSLFVALVTTYLTLAAWHWIGETI